MRRSRRRLIEQSAKRLQGTVEGDLDSIRLQTEELADLSSGQVGAIAKSDQLTLAVAERRHGAAQVESRRRIHVELSRCDLLGKLSDQERQLAIVLGDLSSRDADQPDGRVTLVSIEAIPVTQRPFDRRRGDVLRVWTIRVTDAVCNVRVDAADQRLWVGERIAPGHPVTLM